MNAITSKSYICFLFILIPIFCLSQKKYGGSAYVYVEDDKGKSRVINVTITCYWGSTARAKEELLNKLESNKRYHDSEEFVSQVNYDIDSCEPKNIKYSGAASVKVENEQGKSRIINAIIQCYYGSVVRVKSELLNQLESNKRYHDSEEFIGPVRYDIDSCN